MRIVCNVITDKLTNKTRVCGVHIYIYIYFIVVFPTHTFYPNSVKT